jgi:hypothetical protein
MPIVDRVRKLVDPAVVEFFSVKCFFMLLKSVSLAMLNNHNFYFVSIVFFEKRSYRLSTNYFSYTFIVMRCEM